jgi:hypothetical protein
MTDKMHENWAKPTVPVWEEIKPPQVYGTAKELVHSLRHGYPSPLRMKPPTLSTSKQREAHKAMQRYRQASGRD